MPNHLCSHTFSPGRRALPRHHAASEAGGEQIAAGGGFPVEHFAGTKHAGSRCHHQRGVHAYNYADIPLFDMLFGTFRNPEEWQETAGFHKGSTTQIGSLLAFRKIS